MKGKRGWIRIVEAFVALLLITGVLLFVVNKGYIKGTDISEDVYRDELSILREIELNDVLRLEILKADIENGLVISNLNLPKTYSLIEDRIPDYLDCEAKICKLDKICITKNKEQDVYAQAVVISATDELYSPRQIKLFCWVI